jgi:hypothetical protein
MDYVSAAQARDAQARQRAVQASEEAIEALDTRLAKLPPLGVALAARFSDEKLTHDELLAALRDVAGVHAEVNQVGVAFAPFAFDPSAKFYAPFYIRRGDDLSFDHVERSVDYTEDTAATQWYHQTMRAGAHWSEPHYDPPPTRHRVGLRVAQGAARSGLATRPRRRRGR